MKKRRIQQLFFLVTLPILVVNFLYLVTYRPEIMQKADIGKFHYLITAERDNDFHYFASFYKCKKWSISCDYLSGSYSWPKLQIIHDEEKSEVSLLSSSYNPPQRMIYTDGENPRSYVPFVRFQADNYLFFISEKCDSRGEFGCESATYTLYECELDYRSCDALTFQFTEDGYEDDIAVLENKKIGEFYIIVDRELIYAHGNKALDIKYLDSVTIEHDEEEVEYSSEGCCYITPPYTEEYNIYTFQRDSSIDYFLYGCNFGGECWVIPFSYSAFDELDVELVVDKDENTLAVFVDKQRVFEHKNIVPDSDCYPGECGEYECFVEGCEILEE